MSKKPDNHEWPEELTVEEVLDKIEKKYLNGRQLIGSEEIEKITINIVSSLDNEELTLLLTGGNLNKLEELLIKTYLKNRRRQGNEDSARSIFMQTGIPDFQRIFVFTLKQRFKLKKTKNLPTLRFKHGSNPEPIPKRLIAHIKTQILAATTEGEIG